jgi:3-oxoacyl-[acyl-carrier-protein] synthase-3
MTDIGIAGWGLSFPEETWDAARLSGLTGIPPDVLRDKFGVNRIFVAGPHDQPSQMAARAGQAALAMAGVDANDVDLVVYHGSEYKDFIVWSAAVKIQGLLGTDNAYAFEVYSLCAGAGVALNVAQGMMHSDPRLEHVLLVTASRESDLLDYRNERSRFMFNFSAGGGAMLLRRGHPANRLIGTAVITDPSLSETVVMRAGGTRLPTSSETVSSNQHILDVTDIEYMRDRLGEVSLPNFVRVIRQAVERGGRRLDEIDFLGVTHMKLSFHQALLDELGLAGEQAAYLSDYGHIQSVDQVIALDEGVRHGQIKPGDLVVLAGAGTGYTWSAAAFEWGEK